MAQSQYQQTFTSFSGADIVATFNGKLIGELQAITYSVTREKAPIYTMGDPNPRSFSRGKRGIAGSLVFTVFDRDSLWNLKNDPNVYRHGLNSASRDLTKPLAVHQYDNLGSTDVTSTWSTPSPAKYSDEIPPFDITVNFLNEYGQSSTMTLYGVEILNEGMGMSIDDITTEKACTFIARALDEMKSDAYEQR
jgi:hypothetical protein